MFDLVVVGGGTAGLIAAKTAAGLGARVGLVEGDRTGGDCLWTGCVPSKALLAAAASAQAMRSGAHFGIAPAEPKIDFEAVMGHVHGAIETIRPHDSPESLRQAGVTVALGQARFAAPGRLWAGEELWRFRRAVIATGSAPSLPSVPGLAQVDPLTSDNVWSLRELPERLIVLGGGAIGCELGQAFARLGSQVTLVEVTDRLLPHEEPAASAALEGSLTSEGVTVCTGATVTAVHGRPGDIQLHADGPGGAEVVVAGEAILVATGRTPTTSGLGLDTIGVRTDERGHVDVDARLRTSNPRIYAAGDVTGGPAFTHVAAAAGSIAATNAVLASIRRLDSEHMPWVTFTDPEIAHVGLTEAQARTRHGDSVRTRILPHRDVDRAVVENRPGGFTQVVLDRRGRVLGATIAAPRAAEMISELTAAVTRGRRLREIAGVIHPYPGWGDAVWQTAVAELQEALQAPGTRRVTDTALRLRRALTARTRPSRRERS